MTATFNRPLIANTSARLRYLLQNFLVPIPQPIISGCVTGTCSKRRGLHINGRANSHNEDVMELQDTSHTIALPVDIHNLGAITTRPRPGDLLDELVFNFDHDSADVRHLKLAAKRLTASNVPVAFGTETVYGLGADATRSDAVLGIYKAKQRPLDNPLIVHIASLQQLRALLDPSRGNTADAPSPAEDPIPAIYRPLISKFWPGPLTIICPNPEQSRLVPEVTAGLSTFGARMPRHVTALALISLANVPVAAPSANSSTKPSPTAAEHVLHDLDGRIEYVLDSGPCDVGVESTVVDGLSSPPAILRPGGISLEQIRECSGWEDTIIGYKNVAEKDGRPRAPGMKYRHYSPKAPVILFEYGQPPPGLEHLQHHLGMASKLGLIRTKMWTMDSKDPAHPIGVLDTSAHVGSKRGVSSDVRGFAGLLSTVRHDQRTVGSITSHPFGRDSTGFEILELHLGPDVADIARGIFAALRDLDRHGVDAILIEGIDDQEADTAAAVMNRVRKAAEITISS